MATYSPSSSLNESNDETFSFDSPGPGRERTGSIGGHRPIPEINLKLSIPEPETLVKLRSPDTRSRTLSTPLKWRNSRPKGTNPVIELTSSDQGENGTHMETLEKKSPAKTPRKNNKLVRQGSKISGQSVEESKILTSEQIQAYKKKMIEDYEKQQRDNEERLKVMKSQKTEIIPHETEETKQKSDSPDDKINDITLSIGSLTSLSIDGEGIRESSDDSSSSTLGEVASNRRSEETLSPSSSLRLKEGGSLDQEQIAMYKREMIEKYERQQKEAEERAKKKLEEEKEKEEYKKKMKEEYELKMKEKEEMREAEKKKEEEAISSLHTNEKLAAYKRQMIENYERQLREAEELVKRKRLVILKKILEDRSKKREFKPYIEEWGYLHIFKFYKTIEEFRMISNEEDLARKGKIIFSRFLSQFARSPIEIENQDVVYEVYTKQQYEQYSNDMFDEVQNEAIVPFFEPMFEYLKTIKKYASLHFTVVSARELKKVPGSLDPYCIITNNFGERETYRTSTKTHCFFPEWNETVICDIFPAIYSETGEVLKISSLMVQLFSGNTFLGQIDFPLRKMIDKFSNETVFLEVPLEENRLTWAGIHVSGHLTVKYSFTIENV